MPDNMPKWKEEDYSLCLKGGRMESWLSSWLWREKDPFVRGMTSH